MNAYLFTGWVNQCRQGREMEGCHSLILYGGEEEASWKAFEELLLSPNQGEDPIPTKVRKMVGAPMFDQLLTEAGPVALAWDKLGEEVLQTLEGAAVDEPADLGHGYWVDCDQCVRPEQLSADVAALERELPGDIRSDLNWSPEKTYFFLVNVLTPPPPAPEYVDEFDEKPQGREAGEAAEAADDPGMAFPELAPRELAVVVRARNSVVATWLWRRHAANTPLATNPVRIDGLPGILSLTQATE